METITIKRATGDCTKDVVKKLETKNYIIVLYKNSEPIWGGLYATALLTKNYTEIKTKNGLCLDAAIEIYNETKKLLTLN